MKRTPLKRKSKTSISKLKRKLWSIVSKRIKERDKHICFTSGVQVSGSNAHCGHGIPDSVSGARLRYHPKNLHCQSMRENIHLGGNGGEYYRRQVEKYGQETVDLLYQLKNKTMKADEIYYLKLIELYTSGTWEEIEEFLET